MNPYTPGSGVKPRKLAGRDGDLEAFSLLLQRLAAFTVPLFAAYVREQHPLASFEDA